MMDYDTYWKDLMKNPRIKNPKLVFQSEVEKALLMPSAVIGEYTARKAQSGHRATRCTENTTGRRLLTKNKTKKRNF